MPKPLDYAEVCRRLAGRLPFPIDALAGSSRWGISFNRFCDRDRRVERAILHALLGPWGDSGAHRRLAVRLANCSPEAPCRQWPCWFCKHRYWDRHRAELYQMAGTVDDDEVSACTIVCGIAHPDDPTSSRRIIESFRQHWNVFVASWIPNATWHGRFEIDILPIPYEEAKPFDDLGSYKVRTIRELWETNVDGNPNDYRSRIALPHFHAILVHPGTHRAIISGAAHWYFKGRRRSEVKRLKRHKSRVDNLDDFSRYMRKMLPDAGALPGRGSRTLLPNKPGDIIQHANIMNEFGDYGRDLEFRRLKPRRKYPEEYF